MTHHIDRRTLLAQGLAAATASAIPAAPAVAQQGVGRQSVGTLSPDDPIVESYRTAVRAMKALPNTDPRNWNRMAQVHVDFCPHGNWYFLPWHRAYLLSFERICRQLSNNPTFALPFWDWTTDRRLPEVFSSPDWNGRPNPLHDRTRRLPATPLPADMVGSPLIEFILAEPNFEAFGSLRPEGQNNTAAAWQTRPGTKGLLESNPHDRLHVRVGGSAEPPGNMSTMLSPVDPIFWLHHCNIDRLWDRWNRMGHQNSSSPLWRNYPFNGQFVVPAGEGTQPFNTVVSRLLDLDALNYHYISPPVMMARTEPEPAPRRAFKVEQLRASAKANVTAVARTNAVLETKINLESGGRKSAGARQNLSAGAQRVIAVIRDVDPPKGGNVEVHVFVNHDNLTPETPTSDPHYVGTFTFFGTEHAAHRGKPSFMLDITGALATSAQARSGAGNTINVQLLPVPIPGEPVQDVTFKPARIDVAIL